MRLTTASLWLNLIFLVLMACHSHAQDYEDIEWIALMPADDLEALMNPPDFLANIEDGSALDSVDALGEKTEADEQTKRFHEALTSTRVVDAYNNKKIRIPGFMVPLESDEEQNVTSFFIVPYFGACLHLPPPPPNQIIFSASDTGVPLEDISQPFWFEGKLVIEQQENELGTSAYTLKLDNVELYQG